MSGRIVDRMAAAILKARAPGQTKAEWARVAAANALAAAKWEDAFDEDALIAASCTHHVDAVILGEIWDDLIDQHLKLEEQRS